MSGEHVAPSGPGKQQAPVGSMQVPEVDGQLPGQAPRTSTPHPNPVSQEYPDGHWLEFVQVPVPGTPQAL